MKLEGDDNEQKLMKKKEINEKINNTEQEQSKK